jgi:hypothetical protein
MVNTSNTNKITPEPLQLTKAQIKQQHFEKKHQMNDKK